MKKFFTLTLALMATISLWAADYGPFTITANTSNENPIYGIADADYVGGDGVHTFTIPKVGGTANKSASSNMTYMGATSGSYYYIKIAANTHFYINTTGSTAIKSISIMAARNSTSGQTNGFSYKFGSEENYTNQNMLGYNDSNVPNSLISATATGTETSFDLYSSSKEWIILSISVTLRSTVNYYTITYDKGAYGTGNAIADGEKTQDVAFTLSSETYFRSGYNQTGWATTDGGEKAYDLGGSYTANADITLYPYWEEITGTTHAITYDNLKGQSVDGYPTEYYEGYGVPSFEPLEDVTDYHFTGWSPASIADDATTDQTIEAQWVDAYDVTFDEGAASGTAPASFQKWEGAEFELPGQGDMVAPTGKEFGGWITNGTKYAAGDTYTMTDEAVEFTALWNMPATTIFDWTFKNSKDITTDNTDLSQSDYGTLTTGTAILGRIFGTTSIAKNSAGYKVQSDDACIEIQGTSDFEAGDTIKLYVHGGGNGERGMAITPSTSEVPTTNALVTSMVNGSVDGVCVAILTATQAGEKIRIFRNNGKTMYLKTIKVIRPASEDPGPSTAINNTEEEVKAVKVLRDGQLFIEKNGHVYNVFGACVK